MAKWIGAKYIAQDLKAQEPRWAQTFLWNKPLTAFADRRRSEASGHCPAIPLSWLSLKMSVCLLQLPRLLQLSASRLASPVNPWDNPGALVGLQSFIPHPGFATPENDSEWCFLLCLLLNSVSFESEVTPGDSRNLGLWFIWPVHLCFVLC